MSSCLQKPEQLCRQSLSAFSGDSLPFPLILDAQNPAQQRIAKEQLAEAEDNINLTEEDQSMALIKPCLLPLQISTLPQYKDEKEPQLPSQQTCPSAPTQTAGKGKPKAFPNIWSKQTSAHLRHDEQSQQLELFWSKQTSAHSLHDEQSQQLQVGQLEAEEIEEEETLQKCSSSSSSSSDSDNEEPQEDFYPMNYDSDEDTNFEKYFQESAFLINDNKDHELIFRHNDPDSDDESCQLIPTRSIPTLLPLDKFIPSEDIFNMLNRNYFLRLQAQGGRRDKATSTEEQPSENDTSKTKETTDNPKLRRVIFKDDVQVKRYKESEEVTLIASAEEFSEQLNHYEKCAFSNTEREELKFRPIFSEKLLVEGGSCELRGNYEEEMKRKCLSILKATSAQCGLYKPIIFNASESERSESEVQGKGQGHEQIEEAEREEQEQPPECFMNSATKMQEIQSPRREAEQRRECRSQVAASQPRACPDSAVK